MTHKTSESVLRAMKKYDAKRKEFTANIRINRSTITLLDELKIKYNLNSKDAVIMYFLKKELK